MVCAACRFGEHRAQPPVDGTPGAGVVIDGAPSTVDAPENVFHGMRVTIGDRPEWTGSCSANVPDYATMTGHFATPKQQEDADAGWEFDTSADAYSDPSYGFDPMWPMAAAAERFSARYRATIHLSAGPHCFAIDTGATGTDIIGGKNECGQIWLGDEGAPAKIAETGYQAQTAGPATGCIDQPADGSAELDVVFWYFNVFEQAKLQLRTCDGASCTPDAPLSVPSLVPL
jgi:hypothetical protein